MSEIRTQTQHRWHDILIAFGVEERVLNKRNQCCPFCGGKDRFRFTDHQGNGEWICNHCAEPGVGDGFEFLMRHTGQDFAAIAKEIKRVVGFTTATPPPNIDVGKIQKALMKTWRSAKPLSKGCPTHLYLLSRGLAGISFGDIKNLRCHPSLPYYSHENGKPEVTGRYPAMVAQVHTVDGRAATLHITYLSEDGRKADVPQARKVKPSAFEYKGGAVRLLMPKEGQAIVLAEGIETALALHKLHPDCAPWACLNAGNMKSFVPPGDTAIVIGGDNDASFTGQAAAFELARKLAAGPEKINTRVEIPNSVGEDWNDVLANS